MKRAALAVLALIALLAVGLSAIGGYQFVVLRRGPSLPELPPANDPAGRVRNDALFFKEAVLRNERSFTEAGRLAFREASDRLITRAEHLDQGQRTMEMARAMALADNAHSHLVDARLPRLSFRLRWFTDGLYVVKAAADQRAVVGWRVDRLGGVAADELLRRLDPFLSGTPGWKRYRSEYFLTTPAALAAAGATVSGNAVSADFTGRDGRRESRVHTAPTDVPPNDAFREWMHVLPDVQALGTAGWQGLLDRREDLPLYLKKPGEVQYREFLPALQALYVRLYGSIGTDAVPLDVFLDQTLREISERRPRYVILDLRFNWGGDYTLTRRFSARIGSAIPDDGKIFLIAGPNTFSAGLIMAARVRALASSKTVIVGAPPGDRLEFWAEGFLVDLPSSGVELYLTTARHDLRHGCALFDSCFVLDKFFGVAVESLEPALPAEPTFADYAAGRDPAFDRIVSSIRLGG